MAAEALVGADVEAAEALVEEVAEEVVVAVALATGGEVEVLEEEVVAEEVVVDRTHPPIAVGSVNLLVGRLPFKIR